MGSKPKHRENYEYHYMAWGYLITTHAAGRSWRWWRESWKWQEGDEESATAWE